MKSRRDFLKFLGLSGVTWALLPVAHSPLLAFAKDSPRPSARKGKVFVLIFQRGAMDGLSMVPPIGDPHYAAQRPNIAIQHQGESPALPLERIFYLHPSMKALYPYWQNGSLAFVHQAGSPSKSRSHFDAQDFMELGTPDEKNTANGFLNRALALNQTPTDSILRAIAVQASMPRILQGEHPAISFNRLKDYTIRGGAFSGAATAGFEEMYEQATNQVLRGVGKEMFDSLKSVHSLDDEDRGGYPKTPLGNHLREVATVIKAGLGLEIAVTDMGGWDTHVNQGNHLKGQLGDRLRELSEAIAAFAQDLGPHYQDVCLMTMTEFGRTVKENGNRGTDHGHGSVMMLMGGGVRGRKVYGRYQELAPANLFEGRDVPVTTDFRDVLAEVLESHLGFREKERIFPHYRFDPRNRLRIL